MSRKKIYFNQKSLHRERQADTVKYASEFFDIISPLHQAVDNIRTFNAHPLYMRLIAWIVSKVPTINLRKMPAIASQADYIYTRWDIPLFSNKPYIIELDNPYILTFYNYFAFKLYKPIIKYLLQSPKCKKIVCISEACKQSFLEEMGAEFSPKTVVLYPMVMDYVPHTSHDDSTTKFIFVWLQAKLKWLYELLEAFHSIDNKKISLSIIGVQNPDLQKKYNTDKRIKFLWQIARKDILYTYLPAANILVFPTYFESFGVVALEALSRGLGIITTNVFALPEICQDGYNGKIIPHPYIIANRHGFVDVTKTTLHNFVSTYLSDEHTNKKMVFDIKKAMQQSIKDHALWQQHSKELYETKFSKKARSKSFLSLFQ